jgi:hypothetical protein
MINLYLDPGSGSIILQIVMAGIASLTLGLAAIWNRIGGKKDKDDPDK